MSAWSKLQKSLYLIVADNVDFQIHCSVYRMKSQRGSTDIPRYWITIGKDIIFDYNMDINNNIDLIKILDKTKYGSDGIGGIITKGTMYIGYPRE